MNKKEGKMKNKKAQFYLVAAILILMVISGVVSIKTYSIIRNEPRNIQDISQELTTEGPKVIDYGLYNPTYLRLYNPKDIRGLIEDFIGKKYAKYFLKKTENTTLIVIYGSCLLGNNPDSCDVGNIRAIKYNKKNTGSVTANIGNSGASWETFETYSKKLNINLNNDGNSIKVNIFNKDYIFDINKKSSIFYFLIAEDKNNEKFIETNKK